MVALIHEQPARSGIALYIDICPAIIVEVGGYSRHCIRPLSSCYPALLRDLPKRPIPVILVQVVVRHSKSPGTAVDGYAVVIAVRIFARTWDLAFAQVDII